MDRFIVPLLEYFRGRSEWNFDSHLTTNAARAGEFGFLRHLIENGCPCDTYLIGLLAVEDGTANLDKRLECLRYLISIRDPLGLVWNEKIFSSAACSRQLRILQVLHRNGCPWDESLCVEIVKNRSLGCLRYVHENKCPWDERTVAVAEGRRQYDCLIYAYRNRCPGSEKRHHLINGQLLSRNMLDFRIIVRLRIYVHRFKDRYYAPGGKGYLKSLNHFLGQKR